ncbi:MAG: hypothetical protein WDM77_16045 [Steroidobacteraceae bacterium]
MIEPEDWLDELLSAGRAAVVPDEGFAGRVMARLPSRARLAPRWLLPASLALGAMSAILVSGTAGNVVSALQLLIVDHRLSLAGFLPVMLVWAGCAWALSESR